MGIAFPKAGSLLRQWRMSRRESLLRWAVRLKLPTSYGVSRCRMFLILRHFERTDEWTAPRPTQSLLECLHILGQTCCQTNDDYARFYAIEQIVFRVSMKPLE